MATTFGGLWFGDTPKLPDLPKLSLAEEQKKAAQGNIDVLPKAEELASKANLFSREQINQMLASAGIDMPGVGTDIMANARSMIKGELPEDVATARWNKSVGKSFGLGTGGGGSGVGRDLVARDLGLTSLNLMQEGQSLAENWITKAAQIYEPSMINVSSMFVSPAQQASFDVEERNAQFQHDWMKAQIDAMPDPLVRGLHDMFMSLFSAYLGGSYGGTYDQSKALSGMQSPGGGGGGYNMGTGGFDENTGNSGMYGSPSGPEGDMQYGSGAGLYDAGNLGGGSGGGMEASGVIG